METIYAVDRVQVNYFQRKPLTKLPKLSTLVKGDHQESALFFLPLYVSGGEKIDPSRLFLREFGALGVTKQYIGELAATLPSLAEIWVSHLWTIMTRQQIKAAASIEIIGAQYLMGEVVEDVWGRLSVGQSTRFLEVAQVKLPGED